MQKLHTSSYELSVICEPAPTPGRVNEDAYFFCDDGKQITLLVIDGATARAKSSKLQRWLESQDANATAASYASQLTKKVVASKVAGGERLTARELLLAANNALRNQLESVYGTLDANTILQAEPQLTFLNRDPRLIRLILPVCVATLVKIDLAARRLEFAHAGDTALFLFHRKGHIIPITDDQMGQHDDQVINVAKAIQEQAGAPHFSDVISDERVVAVNRANGVYHNYVDQDGQPDKEVGVGAIDGLPELEFYIQEGTADISDVSGVLVCSDGFVWPAIWRESETQKAERLQGMRERIERLGVSGYFADLRSVKQADSTYDLYPRLKVFDDTSALYVKM